ncbi:MAG TPA: OAM dimerization domain-containing protein [Streptosporangiaceae bacterium]|nr:OAM dimerization domain-containing protein [Streptosporangiaceae bacterium]
MTIDTGAAPAAGPSAPTDPAAAGQVIRPYGDTTGDGMVQLSFSLPVPAGKRAEAAALRLAGKMGLEPASVVHAKAMGPDFTFFIVYGRANHLIDYAAIPAPEGREYPLLTAKEVNLAIRTALSRRLVVVGACIGTDAHTVGIDAILNVKGFAGEKGLEYYREIQVVNMGAQVAVDELVARARAEHADAVLVSQVVTQRNAHLHNAKQMAAAFHDAYSGDPDPAAGRPRRPLLVVGGPRFDTVRPDELGVDRIFGRGTTPAEVASYLVHALLPEAAE